MQTRLLRVLTRWCISQMCDGALWCVIINALPEVDAVNPIQYDFTSRKVCEVRTSVYCQYVTHIHCFKTVVALILQCCTTIKCVRCHNMFQRHSHVWNCKYDPFSCTKEEAAGWLCALRGPEDGTHSQTRRTSATFSCSFLQISLKVKDLHRVVGYLQCHLL